MSEKENLDISKVVSLIMENPALIEQISRLARSDSTPAEDSNPETAEEKQQETPIEAVSVDQTPHYESSMARNDRSRLLCALKPYVSSERAKAIDSMISIADILDMMRSR